MSIITRITHFWYTGQHLSVRKQELRPKIERLAHFTNRDQEEELCEDTKIEVG